MIQFLKRFAADARGATAIEYAVLIVFLGSGVVAALSVFQTTLYALVNNMAQELVDAVS